MDGIDRSEMLMQRGWWSEAKAAIQREDVSPANRTLQEAQLTCRQECARFATGIDLLMPIEQLERVLLERFDRYTVYQEKKELSTNLMLDYLNKLGLQD